MNEVLWVYMDRTHASKVFLSDVQGVNLQSFAAMGDADKTTALTHTLVNVHQRYRDQYDLSLFGRTQLMRQDLMIIGATLIEGQTLTQFVPHVFLWPESSYIDVSIQYTLAGSTELRRMSISKLSPVQQAERQ